MDYNAVILTTIFDNYLWFSIADLVFSDLLYVKNYLLSSVVINKYNFWRSVKD